MVGRRIFDFEGKKNLVLKVRRLKADGCHSVRSACEHVGIASSQYYRWREQLDRYNRGDKNALSAMSRAPKHNARTTSEDIRQEVVSLCTSGNYSSAKAIADDMRTGGSRITTKTVIDILEQAGLYGWKVVIGRDGQARKIRGIL